MSNLSHRAAKALGGRVGFEPTYRGFADLEELTNNTFYFLGSRFVIGMFCPLLVRSQ